MVNKTKTEDYPPVTAVVPVFNRPLDLEKLLKSFKLIDYSGELRIIIVDDCGTMDYTRIFHDFQMVCPQIDLRILRMPENRGPAAARNAAVEKIAAGYIWFLDSDSEIFQSAMLKKAMDLFKQYPDIKGIGEEVYFFNGQALTQQFEWYPTFLFSVSFTKFEDSPGGYRLSIPASNLIIEKKALDQIGLFNPKLTTLEENDVCLRLGARGYKLYSCKDVAVYHHASDAGRENSAFDFYRDLRLYVKQFHRNRIRLVALHKRRLLPFLPLFDCVTAIVIFISQFCRKYNCRIIISQKKGRNIGLLTYAWYHFGAMVSSYYYAYTVFFRKKL